MNTNSTPNKILVKQQNTPQKSQQNLQYQKQTQQSQQDPQNSYQTQNNYPSLQKKQSQKSHKKSKTFLYYPFQRQFLNTIMPLGFKLVNLNQDDEQIEKQYLNNECKALKTDSEFKPSNVQDVQLGRQTSVQLQKQVTETDRLMRINKPKVSLENKFCEGNKPNKKYKTEQLEQCAHLLTKLKKFKNIGESFCKFSEFCTQDIQIHDPVDLISIEQNLKKGRYNDHKELEKDVEKMLDIAFQCNPKGSEIYNKTLEMKAYYQKGLRPIEYNPLEQELNKFQKRLDKITRDLREYSQNEYHFYHRENKKAKLYGIDKQMSQEAKLELKQMIMDLPAGYKRGVWEIVSENSLDNKITQPVLSFNLDALSNRKLREIEKYIKSKNQYMQESRQCRKKKKERKEKERLKNIYENEYNTKFPMDQEQKDTNEDQEEEQTEEYKKKEEEKQKERKDKIDKYIEQKMPVIQYDLTLTTDSSMISEFEDSNVE